MADKSAYSASPATMNEPERVVKSQLLTARTVYHHDVG
jgi:hypothetical protein